MFGFLDWFKIGAGALAGIALATIYGTLIHDPAIKREAREGYVLLSEKTAAEAKAAEMERQRNEASKALSEAEKRRRADDAADKARKAQTDQEIKTYEAKLVAAKRSCLLDDGDLQFLQHH